MKERRIKHKYSKKVVKPLIAVFLMMIGTTSFAQEVEEIERVNDTELNEFNKWDTDADQLWSPSEFESFIGDAGLYGDWDTNYDGIYDDDELYTGFLNAWDTNKDGLISKEEYATGNTEWEREYRDSFDDWDANDDKVLDIEEYAAAMNQTGVFGDWDADQDGAYSETELHNGLFNSYDTDDDGLLSNEEFKAAGLDAGRNE